MKKIICIMLSVCLLITCFSAVAFAADPVSVSGFSYDKKDLPQGVSIEINMFNATSSTPLGFTSVDGKDVYNGSVRFEITLNSISQGNYLVLLTDAKKLPPTKDNSIFFIDQNVGNESVTFNVYPNDAALKAGDYVLYITSNTDTNLQIPIGYYVSFKLGDLNNDGTYDVKDALVVLQIGAKLLEPTSAQFAASDINNDGSRDVKDALLILQRGAKLISDWPQN